MLITHCLLVTVTFFPFFILVHQNVFLLTKSLILQMFSMFLNFTRIFYLSNNFVKIMMFILSFTLLSLLWRTRLPILSFFRVQAITGSTRFVFLNSSPLPKLAFTAIKASSVTWHQRLGHPHERVFNSIVSSCCLPISTKLSSFLCTSCQLCKSSKLSLHNSTFHSNKILDLVYCDVWRPSPTISSEGYKYSLMCWSLQ